MGVVIDDGEALGKAVIKVARRLRFEEKVLVQEGGKGHWLTPLARKPPSTTKISPLTKLLASDERNTHAPTSSSTFPNRFMGVRRRNSRPRSVPSSRWRLRSVTNTPGAIALTHTPRAPHSIASDLVSEATAALLAAYAATS